MQIVQSLHFSGWTDACVVMGRFRTKGLITASVVSRSFQASPQREGDLLVATALCIALNLDQQHRRQADS